MSILGWIVFGVGLLIISFVCFFASVIIFGRKADSKEDTSDSCMTLWLIPLINLIGGIYAKIAFLDSVWLILILIGGISFVAGIITERLEIIIERLNSPPDIKKLKVKGNVRGLKKALGYKKDVKVQVAAIEALEEISDGRAVKPLITALKDKNKDVRKKSAKALGKIGDKRAVKPLITALKDEYKDVRRDVAEALGKIGDERAIEPLTVALKDEYKDVRRDVAEALDNLGWQPDKYETGAIFHIVKGKWDSCVEIGAPAVEPLIAALKDEYKGVRRNAAGALVKMYKSDNLDDTHKQLILVQRDTITYHENRVGEYHEDHGSERLSDCGHVDRDWTEHVDAGIGVDFPI